jgi:hypothetical protein
LALADKYMLTRLKNICEEYLVKPLFNYLLYKVEKHLSKECSGYSEFGG